MKELEINLEEIKPALDYVVEIDEKKRVTNDDFLQRIPTMLVRGKAIARVFEQPPKLSQATTKEQIIALSNSTTLSKIERLNTLMEELKYRSPVIDEEIKRTILHLELVKKNAILNVPGLDNTIASGKDFLEQDGPILPPPGVKNPNGKTKAK